MGDLMAGLGLGILGFIFLQMSDMFIRYPADTEVTPPWPYLTMRAVSFLLFGFGLVVIVEGFL